MPEQHPLNKQHIYLSGSFLASFFQQCFVVFSVCSWKILSDVFPSTYTYEIMPPRGFNDGFDCWQISPLTIVFTPRKETSKLLSLCPYNCDHSSHGPTEQDLEWLGKETEWHLQIMSFYPLIIILSTLTIKNLFSGACSLVGVHSEHKYIYNLCLFEEILPHTSLPNLLFASVLILFLLTPWPSTLMKDP